MFMDCNICGWDGYMPLEEPEIIQRIQKRKRKLDG